MRAPSLKIRPDLVRAPKLRRPSEKHERHATWLELFADLAFVAAVGQIGTALAGDFSWAGLLRGFFLFVPIWWAWVGSTFYLSRFDSDDLGHRALGLLQIVLVVVMAGSVGGAMDAGLGGGPGAMWFSLAYASLRWLLIGLYVLASHTNREFKELGVHYVRGFSASAFIWTVSAFVPGPYQAILWLLGLVVDLTVPTRRRVKDLQVKFPPNESHVPERFGLFTIIVLGEAMLAVLAASQGRVLGPAELAVGFIGLHIAFCTWWIYFEGVKGTAARLPRSRQEVVAYQLWFYSHLLLQFGFVVLSVGVKKGMLLGGPSRIAEEKAGVLILGAVLVFLGLHLIYHSTFRATSFWHAMRNSAPYWFFTIATPLAAWFFRPSVLVLMVVLGAGFLAHVLLTFGEVDEHPKMTGEGPGSIDS